VNNLYVKSAVKHEWREREQRSLNFEVRGIIVVAFKLALTCGGDLDCPHHQRTTMNGIASVPAPSTAILHIPPVFGLLQDEMSNGCRSLGRSWPQ
jgi:hypothetical protein